MKKYIPIVVAGIALLVGLLIGFFVGRATLEAKWANPVGVITPQQHQKSSGAKDADPTPPAGSKRIIPLPLVKMRQVAGKLTAQDPLKVTLTSWGNGEDGGELHLMMKNDAPCKVVSYSGIAYAYNAYGRPVKGNAGGESYIAFRSDVASEKFEGMDKGAKFIHAQVVHHTETASIGVAHVDAYACDDGTKWARQ